MRNLTKILLLTGAIGLGLIGCKAATSVPTPTPNPNESEIQTITKAADRLVSLQHSDGGWGWALPDNVSEKNLYGVTALGLLDAYKATGNSAYLTAAENAATTLVNADTNTGVNGSVSTANGAVEFYSQDIEFLMKLGEVTGNAAYTNKANAIVTAFKTQPNRYTITGQFSAANLDATYQKVFTSGNQGETEWQLASWVRAAQLTGNTQFANDLIAQMNADMSSGYFDIANTGNDNANVYILGLDGELSATGGSGIEQKLVALQQADGTWKDPNGVVENTAYSVKALVKAGDMTDAYKGVQAGMTNQKSNGGWLDAYDAAGNPNPTEYTETDSEVIQAISDYIGTSP